MVRAVPLEASMFPELYSSFLAEDDPRLQESHWRRLFQPPDLDDVRPPGYCLVDSSRIVGVLGTLWSQRTHEDGTSLVCNLHSWMVRPEHRGRSLGLMRPLLKQHDITVTDFSPTRQVFRLMLKMGMKALDGRLRVLLPMPFGRRDADLELIADPVSIEATLSNDDTRILRNHQLPWCRHALLRTPWGDCYIVWSKVDRWAVPYGYIHYVSDRQVFTRHSRLVGLGSSMALRADSSRWMNASPQGWRFQEAWSCRGDRGNCIDRTDSIRRTSTRSIQKSPI